MTLWVFSGNRPSEGAYFLSKEQGFRRMRLGKLVEEGDVVISWGVGDDKAWPHLPNHIHINSCEAIYKAVNKRKTFHYLTNAGVQTVPWTENKAIAQEWLDNGDTVVARTILTGHEGAGIVIMEPGDELVDSKLYTKYIFKDKEFRVHATCLGAFATHRKIRDPKREPTNWKVRSWKNGFIYQRKNIPPNETRDELGVDAVRALGLDFGAVDIIEDKLGNFYVLEVNTAPGIEGETVPAYAAALTALANA